jgi:ATP/maltotriose-dependent transcriptional regulator MalT/DNA-binding SARP family transcriptional activator
MPPMPTTTDGSTRSRGRRPPGDRVPHVQPADADPHGRRIDDGLTASVSSAATDGPATAPNQSWSAPSTPRGHEEHALVAVGPGYAVPALLFPPLGIRPVNPLPVSGIKIQRPILRSDTLSRARLNGWLDRAARGRLVLIVGEAGFGKSTLLADWSSLTHRRTSWYRLEHDDRDWLTLIRHLVAGGRELDEGFAPDTYRLLCALGPGGPTPDELTASLAREMAAFGAAEPNGFSLILDDFHAIEASAETDPVIAALLAATAPGFSLVIAARTAPELPAVRLRGRGAVHRLDGDDLRFDVPETEALFRDAFGIPLEHDVAVDLVARTEGWAALLSLVRTRLEERPDPDPRALVAQLSATQGDLYDFLAEEVLDDLPLHLQEFLMRVSILADVSYRTVHLVDERDRRAIEASISEAEALGLLSRSGGSQSHRFHPLVRDFLVAKLESSVGRDELRGQHKTIAEALEPVDWRAAASHYRAAGEPEAAARVIDEAIPSIIGSGSFEAMFPLLDGTAGRSDRAGALILRSRIEFARGNLGRAITLAELAVARAQGGLAGTAMLNLAALEGVAGFPDRAIERTESALRGQLADTERQVAEASLLLRESQEDGDLAEVADGLRQLANRQEFAGLTRYAAISHLNLANVLNWLGDPHGALKAAVRAETGLADAPGSVERVAAMAARALALLQLRKPTEAKMVLRSAHMNASPLGRLEANLEAAHVEVLYGSLRQAQEALERIDPAEVPDPYLGFQCYLAGMMAIRTGDAEKAKELGLLGERHGLRDVAGRFRTELLLLRARLALGDEPLTPTCESLSKIAASHGSKPATVIASIMAAVAAGSDIGAEVASLAIDDRHALSLVAEEICRSLSVLSPLAASVVADEAHARPMRWRTALKLAASSAGSSRLYAARLLADIADEEDAAFLRELGKSSRPVRELAALVTRRLAPKALLHDLGVVRLELGERPAERPTRRKAMALICFLASRTHHAATRDEALEALWPDFNPEMGVNSLHQAIYYVRRIFDPDFREGISAPYLTFDGDVLALDSSLFDSESGRCWRLLRSTGIEDLAATEEIMSLYQGRFAMDFMYDEWSTDYRETLHAAVLGRVEAAIAASMAAEDWERAIRLGTAMLSIDADADAIELGLLRAYKGAGRHAAAGEQYAHYASMLRDELGVEAPPYDSI